MMVVNAGGEMTPEGRENIEKALGEMMDQPMTFPNHT